MIMINRKSNTFDSIMRNVIGAIVHICRKVLIFADLASDLRQLREEMRSLKETVRQQGATIKAQNALIACLADTVSKQGATIKAQNAQIARLTDTVSKQVKHSKTQGIQFAEVMKTVWRQGATIIQLENRIISLTAQGIVSSENKLAPDYLNSSNVHASLRNAHGDGIVVLFKFKHTNYSSASLSNLSKVFQIVNIFLHNSKSYKDN